MRKALLLLGVFVLGALASGACSSGGECDTCTADSDCKSGLSCVQFGDGSKRCGSGIGATTCRVR
jgi:hypothetical protein